VTLDLHQGDGRVTMGFRVEGLYQDVYLVDEATLLFEALEVGLLTTLQVL
jgi:hypothetical protein